MVTWPTLWRISLRVYQMRLWAQKQSADIYFVACISNVVPNPLCTAGVTDWRWNAKMNVVLNKYLSPWISPIGMTHLVSFSPTQMPSDGASKCFP
jgi:hypothetical protein